MATRWWPSGCQVVVCFDAYLDLRTKFPKPILDSVEKQMPDPFWIHRGLLEELVVLQDKSVWSVRNRIRKLEIVCRMATIGARVARIGLSGARGLAGNLSLPECPSARLHHSLSKSR